MKSLLPVLVAVFLGRATLAADLTADIVRGSAPIPGLKLPKRTILDPAPVGPKAPIANARIEGTFDKPDWNVLLDDEKFLKLEDSKLSFQIPISQEQTQLNLSVIDPLGKIQRETVILKATRNDLVELKRQQQQQRAVVRTPFSVGIGPSFINYAQSRTSGVVETALTAKASFNQGLPWRNWDAGLLGFGTVAVLSKNAPEAAQYLGMNLRIGYSFPFVGDPWRVGIHTGWYFTTMFGSATLGFRNQQGPQLFPSVRRRLGRNAASAYFKFSPIANGIVPLGLSSREIAFGGAFFYALANGRPISLSVDHAQLNLDFANTLIASKSTSIAIGYSF